MRQYRPPETGSADRDRAVRLLEADGYTVIPRSGTFRDLIPRLDLIIGTLGFRILQLLPIHPTPTTYARMGRFGSPFAVLDFLDVDPALAEFDRRTTPLDQFRELVDAVHARGGRLFLDIPVNHTGWASWLQTHHPEWFARDPDDTFRSPGAWGVTWGDLSQLDYAPARPVALHGRGLPALVPAGGGRVPLRRRLHGARRRLGVPGRPGCGEQYPDTVFLLEGLGGPVPVMESLLAEARAGLGLLRAVPELRPAPGRWLPAGGSAPPRRSAGCWSTSPRPTTTTGWRRSPQRGPGCAPPWQPCPPHVGAFGITNGVEWFAREKVQVHGASELNWGSGSNQVAEISRLNALLARHPAFHPGARLQLIDPGPGPVLALRRAPADGGAPVLAVVNLIADAAAEVRWPTGEFPGQALTDLCTGRTVHPRLQEERSVVLPGARGGAVSVAGAGSRLGRRHPATPGTGEGGDPAAARLGDGPGGGVAPRPATPAGAGGNLGPGAGPGP